MTKLENIKFLVLDVDGTMTDAGVYVMEDGRQFKKFNARDGLGIQRAMKVGIEIGIISHSLVTTMIEARANTLGLNYFYVGQAPKVEVLEKWKQKLNLPDEQIAYIGDDINDLEIMQQVGVSACPADAVEDILAIANIQLSKKGGEGCVREFIDSYLLNCLQ